MKWVKVMQRFQLISFGVFIINPFVPNAPFLYPLKTSENCKVFWCFQGVEKGCIGNEWVKGYLHYKIIFCHKAALDAQFMIFLFEEKIMFRSPDI